MFRLRSRPRVLAAVAGVAVAVPATVLALVLPAGAHGSRSAGAAPVAAAVAAAPEVTVVGTASGTSRGGRLTAGPLAVSAPGTLVLALVSTDGPSGSGAARQQVTAVSGGGLAWRRAVRGPGSAGNAEIWYAVAARPVAGLRVSVQRSVGRYHGYLELAALSGADLAAPVAAVGRASGRDSGAAVALTARSAGSLLVAVGNAYDTAAAPTPRAGQRLLGSFVDGATGDTYWTTAVNAAGAATLGVTAPSAGRWTAVAVAVSPAGGPPVPPTSPPTTTTPPITTPPITTPPTTTAPPTTTNPPTTTAPTTPPTTTAPTTTQPPSTGAWPGPSNTGVPAGTTLTRSGPIRVDRAGTVLENLDISGQVDIHAANVTIRNCRITSADYFGVQVVSGNVTIMDSEIVGSNAAAIAFDNWAAYRVNIHGAHADGVKFGSNVVLQDSWLHDFAPRPDSHADGGQLEAGVSDLTIRHNNINVPGGNAALFMSPDLGDDDGAGPVLIDHNLLGGGGWTVYLTDGHGRNHQRGYTVTDNHWLRNGGYGPLDLNEPRSSFVAWSGNVYDDNGAVIAGP
jgi:hypothetical protein